MKRIEIIFKDNKALKLNYNMGSIFHGALMEILPQNVCDIFHKDGVKTFSQFIVSSHTLLNEGLTSFRWIINTLNEEAADYILKPFISGQITSFNLIHKGEMLEICDIIEHEEISFDNLIRQFFLSNEAKRDININFVTPCSFKSNNQYIFFPDIALIYKNIINRFDSCSADIKLNDENTLSHLIQNTNIVSYKIQSCFFHLESIKIPAFKGYIRLRINGPQTLVNLANLIFAFSKWSGIGIKTSLGMGGVFVE